MRASMELYGSGVNSFLFLDLVGEGENYAPAFARRLYRQLDAYRQRTSHLPRRPGRGGPARLSLSHVAAPSVALPARRYLCVT